MASKFLRVSVTREQSAVILLRVDDAATVLHELDMLGPARVAMTRRIEDMVNAAMDALPPGWEANGRVYYGPADVVTQEEARTCGLVFDGEGGRVIHGE